MSETTTVDARGAPVAMGDVVQVDPSGKQREGFFAGCFVLVTELKSWGIQGFVAVPGERGQLPSRAYCRIPSEDFIRVGTSTWAHADDVGAADATA